MSPTEPEDSSAGLVQSVDRALTILETVAASGEDVAISELAADLGVHKSTVSRLLSTLEAHQLVETTDRGRYRLGLGLLGLAASAAFSLDLVKLANPSLRELSRTTGETANLAVLADDSALYLDQVSGTSTLQAHSWVGQRIPLHATSNGKILLAFSEPSILDRICAGPLRAYTPRTLTNRDSLLPDVTAAREDGWAAAVNELEEGLAAVAAPVFGYRGELVASISVSGPSFRMENVLSSLADQVRDAARTVSRRISTTGK